MINKNSGKPKKSIHYDSNEEILDEDDNIKGKIYLYYFDLQDKYSKIYGPKTIVFIQIGKFYEAYCTQKKGYVNLAELEPLLNIKYIRRDESDNKPSQFGINMVSTSKNMNIMIDKGYTIVLFNQKPQTNDEVIERECAGVFSPGTYISDRQMSDANYLLGVYIEEEKQLTGKKTLMAVGLTLVDLSTGKIMIHEFYSSQFDERFGLDELVRIMQTYRPTEIVLYYHPIVMDEEVIKYIKLYLELDKYRNYHFHIYFDKKGNDKLHLLVEEDFKINYQNDFLSKIFDLNYQLSLSKKSSAIEILSLEKKSYATISLIIILKYVSEHNVLLLKNLSYPETYLYNKHLILGNNAIEQLNIIDSNSLEVYDHKIESLFDVINKTSTPMGRRFLKENLLNPLSQENKEFIKKRYDMIEILMADKFYKKIKEELKNIFDMERLHRSMAMGTIYPFQFYRLDRFYQSTTKIITLIKNCELKNCISNNTIKEFLSFQIDYNKEYDFEKLQNYSNFIEIDNSLFKKGIHAEVDKLQDKIDYIMSLIDSINSYLTGIISHKCKKIGNKEILAMEFNEKEGYHFTINKTNESILKKEINKKDSFKIDLSIGERLEIKREDIIFKPLAKGRTKIFITPMLEQTLNLSTLKIKLTKMIKKIFVKSMLGYYSKHRVMMHQIANFVAEIDFLVSGAIVADSYFYCKPIIPSNDNIPSYFQTKKIRHAIIERLCVETEYIPNDMELGNVPDKKIDKRIITYESENEGFNMNEFMNKGKNGVVLFSINWAGKCVDPDQKILMYDGTIKKAKYIQKGDLLMGDDSNPRTVLGTCRGRGEMYKIVPMRGKSYIVNGPHILCLKSSGYQSVQWDKKRQRYCAHWMENHVNRCKNFFVSNYEDAIDAYIAAHEFLKTVPSDKGKILEISVEDYLQKPAYWKRNYYTYHVGVEFPEQSVEIDPYIIGHWLGDETSGNTEITTKDIEIVEYYGSYFEDTELVINKKDEYHYSIVQKNNKITIWKNWFKNSLKKYDLINNKHIPHDYLVNSRENRMKLLAGLIDSDGSNHKNMAIEIIQKNKKLADDIVYLVNSLGFFCEKKKCQKIYTNSKNDPLTGTYYRIYIMGNDFSELPLLLEYKRPTKVKQLKLDYQISSFKIEELGMGKYCGFELDGNHRFLLEDFTVTHNSSFMKSIGIAIILAQIGYYVPASEFIFEPYMALYARITGNDNIFKGLSSFALEMTELDAILMRTEQQGHSTLVIGDEVCRGTEDISGRAIVASALISLSECNSTFIFSSHMHNIQDIPEVKNLSNLRFFHLRAEYDEENDCIIFDRRLVPGSGPSVYGLMVAKYLIKNAKFVNRAEIIKKRLMSEKEISIPTKKSNYNKKLLITNCAICHYAPILPHHKELETHHIHFQSDCKSDGKIIKKPYLHKNMLYNLAVLCRKCHIAVHKGEIIINGYADTTMGPMLDYRVDSNKKISNEIKKIAKLKLESSKNDSKINLNL